jgi:hypothetical protein
MDVREYIETHKAEFFAELKEWLAIPSVSADPERRSDVYASAEWLADYLRATGFPVAEIWGTDGLPSVYAHWPADDPAAPTVLIYGHHDVQPVEPVSDWESPPFEPAEHGDFILARGRPTTRARCSSTRSACEPCWRSPVLPPLRCPSPCSSRAKRSPARRTSLSCCARTAPTSTATWC